jgi:hypothetical protein
MRSIDAPPALTTSQQWIKAVVPAVFVNKGTTSRW